MTMSRRALLLGAAAMTAPAIQAQELKRDRMIALPQRLSFASGGQAITVEAFGAAGARRPAVLMLHGADGLSNNRQYVEGARAVAAAGYQVYLVHYLDRTGQRRANFSTLFQNFMPWVETVQDALAFVAGRPEVDPSRIGIVGISLGAALGMTVASGDRRVRALVDYFGPLPQGAIAPDARLPPTLILHGAVDPIVPVANAYAVEGLLKQSGTAYEIQVYPGQGHGFYGAAQADATRRVIAFLERTLGAPRAATGEAPVPAGG
ncbi:dienelactone hydrolase family protein [Microvirga pudoricolor]|uniref:dienelactone hydrolase family protein n=1 Tax=Microvirga pudoricolor TaxID=2778729 RepID=UPI00194E6B30|nr:dienelactone hydrolase family protein [Microvirga pudoricolor]MBM6594790.1 dienelactone hydrolase family protein [Microvirga pudoricolor]